MRKLLVLVLVCECLMSAAIAQVSPLKQDAIIWFYRPANSPSSGDLPMLHEVGGLTVRLGKLAPGEFFGYPVAPGNHIFSYTRAPARGQSLKVLVEEGQQAFVEVQFRELKSVSAKDGIEAIRQSRPIAEARALEKSLILNAGSSATPVVSSQRSVGATETTIVAASSVTDGTTKVGVPSTAGQPTIMALPSGVAGTPKSAGTTSTMSALTPAAASPRASASVSSPSTFAAALSGFATPSVSAAPKSGGSPIAASASLMAAAPVVAAAPASVAPAARPTASPVQPTAAARAEPVPVSRVNEPRPRPALPEQPVSFTEVFPKATLNLGAGNKPQEVVATVAFDANVFWVLNERGGTLKAFPYASIKIAEYSYSKSARWQGTAPGSPAVSSSGSSKHWLMVQTEDDYALIHLNKDNYRSAVAAFELRTGKKVETAADSR